jgi:ABC-type sugar transport system ATPase subunit
MDYILEVQNLTKEFPGVVALDRVELKVKKGEVHAVVGENGAGKSTLMKILGGQYMPDNGRVLINGEEQKITSIDASLKLGISVIYQEFNLVPELSVAENIYITRLPVRGKILNIKELNKNAAVLLEKLHLDINPATLTKDLSVSQQQMVEIAKAISYDSEIIIMDEPTAALTDKEVDRLFTLIGELKESGKTILYISHRLKEIFQVTDRVTVLRDGKYIGTFDTPDMNEEQLILKMVGREISNYYHTGARSGGVHEEKLRVENLSKKGKFKDISFTLHKGEILGVAGLMGSYREEIVNTLFGLEQADTGDIFIDGKKVDIDSPISSMQHKIVYVTADRKEEGILPLMGVKENITISILKQICNKFGIFLNTTEENKILDYYIDYLDIKCASVKQKLFSLSGGNQQKVLLARSLATSCEILIMMEPTRGIDVGAKSEIYNLLQKLANQGISILLLTSETNELLTICDRVIVVFQGKLTGDLVKDESSEAFLSENNLMFCTTGNKVLFSQGEEGRL